MNTKRMVQWTTVLMVMFFVICGWGTPPAGAQQKVIELKFGGLWPPAHPFSEATKLWIAKIEKETDGRVKIKPYWAGALYKPRNSTTELAKGVADIGDYSGAYAPSGFDFEKAMRMAMWGVTDRHVMMKAWWDLLAKQSALEEEHLRDGIKVMAWGPIGPYQLASHKPIRKLADFTGLTLKTTGDIAKLAAALGATGTTISMGETYLALQKRTVDGGFVTNETLKSFKFAEVAKYVTQLNIASAPSGHWGMSLKVFNSLPPDIQKVFVDNIRWFSEKISELTFAVEDEGVAFAKQLGVEFITLPKEDLNKIYGEVDKLVKSEMQKIDAKGIPGTAVYTDLRALVDKYNRP